MKATPFSVSGAVCTKRGARDKDRSKMRSFPRVWEIGSNKKLAALAWQAVGKHCPPKEAPRMWSTDVCTTTEQHFLSAHTSHGQSTCSCGGASWAESHFGRVIARRRHLKLYMALVNGNVCIALCRFFFPVHIHTSSSTTANTRDRCLLPCRSTTFSR